jgi:hypothetical protein
VSKRNAPGPLGAFRFFSECVYLRFDLLISGVTYVSCQHSLRNFGSAFNTAGLFRVTSATVTEPANRAVQMRNISSTEKSPRMIAIIPHCLIFCDVPSILLMSLCRIRIWRTRLWQLMLSIVILGVYLRLSRHPLHLWIPSHPDHVLEHFHFGVSWRFHP